MGGGGGGGGWRRGGGVHYDVLQIYFISQQSTILENIYMEIFFFFTSLQINNCTLLECLCETVYKYLGKYTLYVSS